VIARIKLFIVAAAEEWAIPAGAPAVAAVVLAVADIVAVAVIAVIVTAIIVAAAVVLVAAAMEEAVTMIVTVIVIMTVTVTVTVIATVNVTVTVTATATMIVTANVITTVTVMETVGPAVVIMTMIMTVIMMEIVGPAAVKIANQAIMMIVGPAIVKIVGPATTLLPVVAVQDTNKNPFNIPLKNNFYFFLQKNIIPSLSFYAMVLFIVPPSLYLIPLSIQRCPERQSCLGISKPKTKNIFPSFSIVIFCKNNAVLF